MRDLKMNTKFAPSPPPKKKPHIFSRSNFKAPRKCYLLVNLYIIYPKLARQKNCKLETILRSEQK